jgi:hypothetical protein
VDFDQIVSGFHERFVRPGSWLTFAGKLAKRTCILRIRDRTQVKTEVPDVPLIRAEVPARICRKALVAVFCPS